MELELHEERRLPDSDIQLSVQEQKPLGKYGRMRRAFLQENNTLLYNHLILTGEAVPAPVEIQETATARMEQMMADLLKANPAPDKKLNQMAWVQHMNMLESAGRGSHSDGTYQQLKLHESVSVRSRADSRN